MLDQYTGQAPTDWIGAQAAAAAEAEEESSPTPAGAIPVPVPDGEYRDAWYGSATITTVGTRQIFNLTRTPGFSGALEHTGNGTYIVHWKERRFNADATVTFARKPDGSIARITLAAISPETDSSFDFHDLVFTPVQATGSLR